MRAAAGMYYERYSARRRHPDHITFISLKKNSRQEGSSKVRQNLTQIFSNRR